MAALTGDRNTLRRERNYLELPLAAGAVLHAGGVACLDATGYLVPASTTLGLVAVGRVEAGVSNAGGLAGDVTAVVRPGLFLLASATAADAITQAEVGRVVYLVDDQTVAKTNGGGTRAPAGVVWGLEHGQVWVEIDPSLSATLALALA
ncbi:hypothetical protein [Megalodesulfovibrio paquesii]